MVHLSADLIQLAITFSGEYNCNNCMMMTVSNRWKVILSSLTMVFAFIALGPSEIQNSQSIKFDSISSQISTIESFRSPIQTGTSTVIAVGTYNDIVVYKQFVGSLRYSGFRGSIILGIQKQEINLEIQHYLLSQNVTIKYLIETPCRHHVVPFESSENNNPCVEPYADLKLNWSGYALARDWLQECKSCTGPVLLTPLLDVFFQNNPFVNNDLISSSSENKPFLHLFEEHPLLTTKDWTVDNSLKSCKDFRWDVPLLKSMVLADQTSMTFYLQNMVYESYEWMEQKKCQLSNFGDESAIQNYLFYNSVVAATVHPHRTSVVNSVGFEAMEVKKENGSTRQWETSSFLLKRRLIDSQGYFLNFDGTRSSIVHQFTQFGKPFIKWMDRQPFMAGSKGLLDYNIKDSSLYFLAIEKNSRGGTKKKILRNKLGFK
mmetsp:Transcript_2407/g.3199  ORF Transcript_2407/g.3199 Transcript_2407/m.3199 type:complete len:432 (+) Transcript_2407:105-1400(+)